MHTEWASMYYALTACQMLHMCTFINVRVDRCYYPHFTDKIRKHAQKDQVTIQRHVTTCREGAASSRQAPSTKLPHANNEVCTLHTKYRCTVSELATDLQDPVLKCVNTD